MTPSARGSSRIWRGPAETNRSLFWRIALSRHWWEQRWRLFGYRFDERVLLEVLVVLSYNGFCFPQRSKPPLYLQIFISREALYNSTLFYEQLEFGWLIVVFGVACNFRD